jgi:hypothetical protein
MYISWSAVPDVRIAGYPCNKLMCSYDLYVTFQKLNITFRPKLGTLHVTPVSMWFSWIFRMWHSKAVEMKSLLISNYYKHEQDQSERFGCSNVFEMYKNSVLACHLLHFIQHFRATGIDCLPRSASCSMGAGMCTPVVKWPGREADHSPTSSAQV